MANENTLFANHKIPKKTASDWERLNPVIIDKELIAVDTANTGTRFKIGDGVKTYTQLPFVDESLYSSLSTKADRAYVDSVTINVTDKHYVYMQSVAASVWTVHHQLSKYPSVSVVDSAGSAVIGDVNYIDQDTLTITFTGAFSGKAYLN